MTAAPAPNLETTLPAKLKISTAELSVLLSALDINAEPFLHESELLTVSKEVMHRRLLAARESLLLRQLATVRPDKSLEVIAPLRELLLEAVGPKVGLQLMHTHKTKPAVRIQFSLAHNGHIVAHTLRANDQHQLERLPDTAAIVSFIVQLTAAKAVAGPAASYAIPHAVLAALAQTPAPPEAELLPQLTASGLSETDAAAVLAAGLRPTQQSVLSAIALKNNTPSADSVLWFSDEQTGWLINRFAQGGQVNLQPATPETLTQAVQGLLQAATA